MMVGESMNSESVKNRAGTVIGLSGGVLAVELLEVSWVAFVAFVVFFVAIATLIGAVDRSRDVIETGPATK